MTKPGRRTLPTETKRRRGNPGKRPLNDQEPTPSPDAPTMPRGLDSVGKREWRWLVATLARMGLLASSDRAIMALYCYTCSRLAVVRKQIADEHCALVLEGHKGGLYVNPLINVEAMLNKEMLIYLREFGLSPSSRAGVTSTGPVKQKDPKDKFFRLVG